MQKPCLLILFLLFCCGAAPAFADNETEKYTGDPAKLKTTPGGEAGAVYAGPDGSPSASANTVTVDYSSGTNPQFVFGGYALKGGSADNSLTITKGTVEQYVHGGYTGKGNVTGNKVTISTGSGVLGVTVGGFTLDGKASGNEVTITGGTLSGDVTGGHSENIRASGNTVTLDGGLVEQEIRGGFSQTGTVDKNKVILLKGTSQNFVYGGFAYEGGATTNNKVEVHAGDHNLVFGGMNATGSVAGDVTGNEVVIYGGTIISATGGETRSAASAKVISENVVTIHDGTVGAVVGGQTRYHPDSIAKDNIVNFIGGTVEYLYGGIAEKSEGNTLNMYTSGKVVKILGMFQKYNFFLPSNSQNGDVILTVTNGGETGGTITLSKATVNVGLQSGKDNVLKAGDEVTLIDSAKGFDTATPTKGEGLQGFGTIYDFDISVKDGVDEQQFLVATVHGDPEPPVPPDPPVPPKPDPDPPVPPKPDPDPPVPPKPDPDPPVPPKPGRKNPQLKSLLEGALGSFAMVSQGAEMVAGNGMNSAMRAAKMAGVSGPVAFGSLAGSMSRYNTGSHVKVESVNFLAGLGWNCLLNDGKNGSILAGVFFETGFGNYNAHNSFSSRASVRGEGDTRYFGGGVLSRYTLPNGLYAEGSLRAGKVKNEYSSKDFRSGAGERAEYDSSVAYFGAHGGIGYLWQFRENTSLDISSKYIWTHQNDDKVKIGSERLYLDKVNSHRWRTGARLTHEATLRNGVVASPYLGAAFDYEFGGWQKGTFKGSGRRWKIDSPTLKGGTGMGELGVTVKPSAASPVSFDFSVQGYTGKREGVGGNVNLRYEF